MRYRRLGLDRWGLIPILVGWLLAVAMGCQCPSSLAVAPAPSRAWPTPGLCRVVATNPVGRLAAPPTRARGTASLAPWSLGSPSSVVRWRVHPMQGLIGYSNRARVRPAGAIARRARPNQDPPLWPLRARACAAGTRRARWSQSATGCPLPPRLCQVLAAAGYCSSHRLDCRRHRCCHLPLRCPHSPGHCWLSRWVAAWRWRLPCWSEMRWVKAQVWPSRLG